MINPLDPFFGNPPAKLKVFAPNGETKEITGHRGIRGHDEHDQLTELFLRYEDGKVEVLSKKVVVQNMDSGLVCYNPRTTPKSFNNASFITGSETFWLKKNPHWPAILELQDNPVEGSDHDFEGIN